MKVFKDQELDRLGAEKDLAYQKLSLAREERKRLGARCTKLHDDLDAAYKLQNQLYDLQQSAWESHKSFMQDCSNHIEFNKNESEKYYNQMISAFENASRAHDNHDGAGAKSWSEEGHRCKTMMRSAKEQISHWVSQSRDAKYRFENSGYKVDFENAKNQTARMKREFEQITPMLKNAKSECDEFQKEFDAKKAKFDERLKILKETKEKRDRIIGAIALDDDYYIQRAIENWHTTPRSYQFGSKKSDVYVTVSAGWSRDKRVPGADIIVRDKSCKGVHYHIVIDAEGNELIAEWRFDLK